MADRPVTAITLAYISALVDGDRFVLGANSDQVFVFRERVGDQLRTQREHGGDEVWVSSRRWARLARLTPPPAPESLLDGQPLEYGHLPKRAVPILSNVPSLCLECPGTVAVKQEPLRWSYVHTSQAGAGRDGHRIGDEAAVRPRCAHCGAVGFVTVTENPWYDSADCSRCLGSVGRAVAF